MGVYSRTIFLPFNLNPYKYMAHADLFVLSSIFEGFPIVLAEVSSLRIPFVEFSRKAIPEKKCLTTGCFRRRNVLLTI